MKNQERLDHFITLLNLAPPQAYDLAQDITEYIRIRDALRAANICYCVLFKKEHPLIIYTREEALAIFGQDSNAPYEVRRAFAEEEVEHQPIFLDETKVEFWSYIIHFVIKIRTFADKCIAGHVDTTFLNTHLNWEDHEAEFSATSNPMRPIFCPTLPSAHGEDWGAEKALCYRILYPLVLDPKAPLTKIKCCRNCGKYFIAKRLSATFCSDKCRGAYHYAASGD